MSNPLSARSFFSTHFLVFLMFNISCTGQTVNQDLKYISSEKPNNTPKVFSPGFVSLESQYEYGSNFSKKGDEFFFAVNVDDRTEIRQTSLINNKWSTPVTIVSDKMNNYADPTLSPNEQKLYYISNRPSNQADKTRDFDIWFVERIENGWSAPVNAGEPINSPKDEYYISFDQKGTMFFSSNKSANEGQDHNFDIYYSKNEKGKFQEPVALSSAINTDSYEADVFIAYDQSYMIFCSRKRSGLGQGDLYISFKNTEGEWSQAVSMGPLINSEHHELCPYVSPDGMYFFYTSKEDIYWVSTDIFNSYRGK